MRQLKHHEKKLLKKVDFINWKAEKNLYTLKLMRKFRIEKREDLTLYNKYTKQILDLAKKIKELPAEDLYRTVATAQLLEKLYAMGLIPTRRNLELALKVSAAAFCRRRLPVVMVKCHMAQTVKAAATFVEQGHVRIGPEICRDPARLVTRNMEDFLTWTETSAIKRQVLRYNEQMDDFDLAN
ncbi:hypothetical protein ACOMHN_040368 [Nucella lapillus]